MVLFFILIVFVVILVICSIISSKNEIFCSNFKTLYNNFKDTKTKIIFNKLNKSCCFFDMKFTLSRIKEPLIFENEIVKNKNFLITITKFVDYKINKTNCTFRSKNGEIIIDSVAEIVASQVIKSNNCSLFKIYNKCKTAFSIRQKEDKIFKVLLAQKLLVILGQIEEEFRSISKIILKSKSSFKLKKYKKQIYQSAQIYSVVKYNKNSTKILYNSNIEKDKVINDFFSEMLEAEYKTKLIITYLKVMFS